MAAISGLGAITLSDGVELATSWAMIAAMLGAGAGASSVSSFALSASKIASEEFLLL